MKTSNIAILDTGSECQVREDRGDYDVDPKIDTEHIRDVQRQIDDALNLAGLLLVSLEDEGDARAMQIHTTVRIIETKLEDASVRLDEHEGRHTDLHLAYTNLRNETKENG